MTVTHRFRRLGAAVGLALAATAGVAVATADPASAGVATGKVISGSAPLNVRSTPSTAGTVLRSIPNGTIIGLNCYAHGSTVTGPYGATDIWDAIDGGGYVTDAYVYTGSNAPVVPPCGAGDPRPGNAVAWAVSRIGLGGYNGYCELFVENAYGTSGRYATALANRQAQAAAGRLSMDSANIPAGALVFYDNAVAGPYGHVEIARGNGRFITSDNNVSDVSFSYGGTFRGWAMPPDSWPGR
jgi:uncharacterized protein YraI